MENLTKSKLADALKEEMKTIPFEKISVKELAEKCNVNRQTFYYHFADIYELLEWLCKKEFDSIAKNQSDASKWQEAVSILLKYIKDNKAFCLCAMNSDAYSHIRQYLFNNVAEFIKEYVSYFIGDVTLPKDFMDFLVTFYSYSFAGIFENLILGNAVWDDCTLIEYLEIMIKTRFLGIKEYFAAREIEKRTK